MESKRVETVSASAAGVVGVRSTLLLASAIAVTTLCAAPPLGIPAIFYALGARAAERAGAPELARRRARMSVVFSAVGVFVGVLFELYLLVRHLAAGFQ
jgi:Interferon-induced transmembrane protein